MNLLSRIRKINAMLQNRKGTSVNFMEMSETLCEVIDTNVFVVSSSGKILGHALSHQVQSERMKEILKQLKELKDMFKSYYKLKKQSLTLS